MSIAKLSEQDRIALGQTVVRIADSDGQRRKEEVDFIEGIAKELGVAPQKLLYSMDTRPLKEILEPVENAESKEIIVEQLIRMAYVDKEYAATERAEVRRVSKLLGLTDEQVNAIEARVG